MFLSWIYAVIGGLIVCASIWDNMAETGPPYGHDWNFLFYGINAARPVIAAVAFGYVPLYALAKGLLWVFDGFAGTRSETEA